MIEKVFWPKDTDRLSLLQQVRDLPSSPFEDYGRPLRITYHNSGLNNLPEVEKKALATINDFAKHSSVDIIQTEKGTYPNIEFDKFDSDCNILLFHLKVEHKLIEHGIHSPDILKIRIREFLRKNKKESRESRIPYNEIYFARAHYELNRDLFVTNNSWLINNRTCDEIKVTNPRTPKEALKILGLLLRSKNDFCISNNHYFNRGLFYWALVRYNLPAMWGYFNACVKSEKYRSDDILILGNSILSRSVRCYQACDEIGKYFYHNNNNDSRDGIMYHFDYLNILLSGILDAQARIIYRVFDMKEVKNERFADFQNIRFIKEIKKLDRNISEFITDSIFKHTYKIISDLRNTVHGANLQTIGHKTFKDPEDSFIMTSFSEIPGIRNLFCNHEKNVDWGVFKVKEKIFIEPYTFSTTLLNRTIKMINSLAELTPVEKLFPEGIQIPELNNNAPDDNFIFSKEVGERLNYLF